MGDMYVHNRISITTIQYTIIVMFLNLCVKYIFCLWLSVNLYSYTTSGFALRRSSASKTSYHNDTLHCFTDKELYINSTEASIFASEFCNGWSARQEVVGDSFIKLYLPKEHEKYCYLYSISWDNCPNKTSIFNETNCKGFLMNNLKCKHQVHRLLYVLT